MKTHGLVLSAGLCLLPLLWLPQIAAGKDLIALFSQYLGMVALITMALGQIIATRWPGIEPLFGPLDQSYRLHKWLGISGLVAILLHDTIDAEMRGLGAETLLVEAAETAGEISLYGILILVVITIATFIPYHLWKWTHRLIGIFFVMGSAHYLFILKPFKNGDPLGIYMAVICAMGTVAYLYTSAPRGLRPSRRYRIETLSREGAALSVEMRPEGAALRHVPGQFAFFAFSGAGMSEPHPFTISSAPDANGRLRVTIAPLGDLTTRVINALEEGQEVRVDGAYGRFGRTRPGPQLWVAAGVGVTPFVALAEALDAAAAPVRMICSVRSREDAVHGDLLQQLADSKPNLDVEFWESTRQGRLNAEALAEKSGVPLGDLQVLFCGPAEMRRALGLGLARLGLPRSRFHYEEFEIRTGLGLRRLLKRFSGSTGATSGASTRARSGG